MVEGKKVNKFCSRGDLGDAIALLPTIRALGGGSIVFGPHTGKLQGREEMRGSRFEAIKPILEAQPYIGSVTWQEVPKGITHDLTNFRSIWAPGCTLLELQSKYLGVTVSDAPWLWAMRSPKSLGRTVFARSPRYQNPQFPWNALAQKHRNALFVGSEGEYEAFRGLVGNIEFCPTPDLLTLAEIIAGCSLFVGNQSCPFWIAVGLGVPLIQETWPHDPNSIVKRPNARYLMRPPFIL